jgi:sec-independent protein translocase protein TatA
MPGAAAAAGSFSIMSLGIPELLVILVIVVLIFGASRLPELGKGIGKGIKNFKEATRDGEKAEKEALDR